MVRKEELFFESRDNKDKIHAVKWIPQGEVKWVLQIIHGMAEHINCYDDFASAMAERGILVVGEDHLGHGKSVPEGGITGYFCKEDAATVVVRDVHRLKKMVQQEHPGIPYVILGHSMGSFILRNYLLRYGKGIDAAIIMGTGIQSKGTVLAGKALARILSVFQVGRHRSSLLHKMAFGSYNKQIENPSTGDEWICSDKTRLNSYASDDLCGFVFTLNGFHTLFTLIDQVTNNRALQKMPKELPVLLTSGLEDPVGNYGEGVKKLYEEYKAMGMKKAEIKLYSGFRHEILNETGKKDVYSDLYQWIASVLEDGDKASI